MGWWREADGKVIGDGPADHFAEAIDRACDPAPCTLAQILGAFEGAVRRNPSAFAADPERLAAPIRAWPKEGPPCEAVTAPAGAVDAFHSAVEASALDYRESELARLPSTDELLETLAFVLRPRVPERLLAPAGFELDHISAGEDRSDGARRVAVPPSAPWPAVEAAVLGLGLTRDRDSIAQPARPEFASWTRQPGLELEVDWHGPPARAPWLELRGEGAQDAAATLAEALGGRLAPDESAALAELLTVPPAASTHGNAEARWEILAAVLRAAPEIERRAAEPLVEAGLRDPDWRVRMTAVWGVGLLRITRLADSAGSAPLPAAGYEGLDAEDRRNLLALREAAGNRASGRTPAPPVRDGGGPGGAKRAAFVARIAALFDGLAPPPRDRHEALLMALLRMPAPVHDRIPRAWKAWMG